MLIISTVSFIGTDHCAKAYVICEEGTVKVRRLARQGGKLIIRSQDRKNFPDYEAEENFSIIGRVIWVGHEVK